jgi:hypothetical protein
MITNPKSADQIRDTLLGIAEQMHDSLRLARETCTEEDLAAYKHAVTQIMCQVFTKLLVPISEEHPIESPDPEKPFRRHPMIGNVDTAKKISELMFKVSKQLEESLEVARETASAKDFSAYAKGVGTILTDIMYEVLNPVFAKHPGIEPVGWK